MYNVLVIDTKENTMTTAQKEALKLMADNNDGAIALNGKWIFPCHIRESEIIAMQVVARYESKVSK